MNKFINNQGTFLVLVILLISFTSAISYNLDSDNSLLNSKISVKTGLNVSSNDFDNLSNGQIMRVYMSNGFYSNVKIMPSEASLKALAVMEANCEERNCTVELKENGFGNNTHTVYEVKAQKNAKLFGFIKMNMNVKADVDAQTGKVNNINKPWWAKLAVEEDSQVKI